MKKSTRIVISIIVVVAGLAIYSNYRIIGQMDLKSKAADDLFQISGAIELYKSLHEGRAPATLDELASLDQDGVSYLGKGITQVPRDPWTNEYVYIRNGDGITYTLLTYGMDGSPGGDGASSDLSADSLLKRRR